jgi:hypothetical protein
LAPLFVRVGDESGLDQDRRHVVRGEHREARLLDRGLVQVVHGAQALEHRIAKAQAVVDGRGLRKVHDGALDVVVFLGERDAADEIRLVLLVREDARHFGRGAAEARTPGEPRTLGRRSVGVDRDQ